MFQIPDKTKIWHKILVEAIPCHDLAKQIFEFCVVVLSK